MWSQSRRSLNLLVQVGGEGSYLFVSNMDGRCRLFHNEGHDAFRDVAAETGITRTQIGRPFACWFWDFDNDGWLDVFVNDYDCSLAETIADYMGVKLKHLSHPVIPAEPIS